MTTEPWQIVFVYLGKRLPKYVISNLARCRQDFPDNKIILGSDCVNIPTSLEIEVLGVTSGTMSRQLYSGFRNGFWLKSIERLVVLEQIHSHLPSVPLLHVEADVRLAPYFDFSSLPKSKLGWGQVSEREDGAALLSSPNYRRTSWLSNELRKLAAQNPGITDMPALNRVRSASPNSVSLLPSKHEGNIAVQAKIFDFAAVGMWAGGTDPRNTAGVSRLRTSQKGHELKLEEYDLKLNADHGEILLSAPQGGSGLVQNLHLHAKQPIFFELEWDDLVRHLSRFSISTRFYPRAFGLWLLDRFGEYLRLVRALFKRLIGQGS